MMTGPIQHFRSAILEAWRFHVFAKLSERKGFWGVQFADRKGSLQLLMSSHLRGLEWIPSWQGQKGRRSLSFLWEEGW